jgi:hypothetical protein
MYKASKKERFKVGPPIFPKRKKFFINGELHELWRVDKGQNMIYAFDYKTKEKRAYILSQVKKDFEYAFTIGEVCRFIGRHPDRVRRAMHDKQIERGTIARRPNKKKVGGTYYFSESQLMDIRDYFASVGRGRPRKDGIVFSWKVPSKEELRAMIGRSEILYVKTSENTFVPIWQANEF